MIFFFFCVLHFAGGFIIILHRFGGYDDCFSFSVIPILPGFVPWAIRNSGFSEAVSKTSSPPLTHGSNPNLCVWHWSQLLIKKKKKKRSFLSPLCGDDSDSCWCSTVRGKVDSTDTSNCLKGQTLLVECFFSNSCNSPILFTEKQIAVLKWTWLFLSFVPADNTASSSPSTIPFFPTLYWKKLNHVILFCCDWLQVVPSKQVSRRFLVNCLCIKGCQSAAGAQFSTVFQF